ncbi:MAG TPA: hypothetical protein VJ911_05815 [Cryomorphaceae bacterium]|nr:hypothetical protein [Cryomorphaceae bacterium]
MTKTFYAFMIFFSLIFLSVSCSSDDDSDPNNNSGGGGSEDIPDTFITINITGDETGEFSSDANSSLSGSGNSGYQFIIARGPEDALENTSFSIFLNHKTSEIPPQPIPEGSYGLTSNDEQVQDDGSFSLQFTNFKTESNFGYEVNGQLEITESNDNYMEGDFSCTTTSFTNGEEEIQMTGSFLVPAPL